MRYVRLRKQQKIHQEKKKAENYQHQNKHEAYDNIGRPEDIPVDLPPFEPIFQGRRNNNRGSEYKGTHARYNGEQSGDSAIGRVENEPGGQKTYADDGDARTDPSEEGPFIRQVLLNIAIFGRRLFLHAIPPLSPIH